MLLKIGHVLFLRWYGVRIKARAVCHHRGDGLEFKEKGRKAPLERVTAPSGTR